MHQSPAPDVATPDIKLILSDVDGTMLPYGASHITAAQRATIHRVLDAGLLFGPCSGRGRDWLAPIFEHDATCYATAIATNGQAVYLDGRTLREPHFSPALVAEFVQAVQTIPGAGALAFVGPEPYVLAGSVSDLERIFPKYAGQALTTSNLPLQADITKLNAFALGSDAHTHEVAAQIASSVPTLDTDVPQPNFINVMHAGQNKATGIDLLCKALNITLDQVVVFGDGGNDVAMLSHVPNSVAVAGAVPEAQAAARFHIDAAEKNAVFDAISALATGAWPFSALYAIRRLYSTCKMLEHGHARSHVLEQAFSNKRC